MLLNPIIINSRADLDYIAGTPYHTNFMRALKASITRKKDVANYPEGYGQPDYDGPLIEPVWEEYKDLSAIERWGFTKADFDSLE